MVLFKWVRQIGEGRSNERPRHLVNVPAFYCGKYPVTQAQWKVVAGFPRVNRDLDKRAFPL